MPRKSEKPVILMNMAAEIHNGKECEILISQYASRVSDSGCLPLLIPSIEKRENILAMLELADGVLLIGGKDYHPKYYGCEPHPKTFLDRLRPHFDLTFAKTVLEETNLPVLGICAGCQLLNIVSGGKLIQHLPNAEQHTGGTTHQAFVRDDGFFARIVQKTPGEGFTVNSFHHQAVDPEHLGKGFRVTAAAFDGSVEVIETSGPRMILGLQFHPERMDELGPSVFTALKEQAERYRKQAV